MSDATSVVGTWTGYVAWGNAGPPVTGPSTIWTFNADGSWTYLFGGGRWIQVEGLVFWNFTGTAGLVYTGNVTRNAVVGIMGYAINPGAFSGAFYMTRQYPATAAATALAADKHDYALGPLTA